MKLARSLQRSGRDGQEILIKAVCSHKKSGGQRAVKNVGRHLCVSVRRFAYLTMANMITSVKMTSVSMKARPMIIRIWMRPLAPGLRAAPSAADDATRD